MKTGIIGGSGFYQLRDCTKAELISVDTPYGKPSGDISCERSGDNLIYFVPRHGPGHTLLPSEINYRANLYALKKLGVTRVISVSAVGSLREDIGRGDFVLPDQYIDLTRGIRPNTFFGRGIVAHAHFADPCCETLRGYLSEHAGKVGVKCHQGGIYVCIEGPQFSTRAESHWFRSWHDKKRPVSVIGMTALPEARLARELGLCYQTVAMSTDYDCWNEQQEDVSVEAIIRTLKENVSSSRKLLTSLFSGHFPPCRSHCAELMKNAVITAKELWPVSRLEEMKLILGE